MAKAGKTLSAWGILREALALPKNNKKLIFHVFLIALVTSTILFVVNQLTIQPVVLDLVSKSIALLNLDPTSPVYSDLLAAIKKGIREVAVMVVVFVVVSFFIGVAVKALVIYATAVAYTMQEITLKEALWKVKGMLKGPLLTQLLVALLSFVYMFLLTSVVMLLVFVIPSRSTILVLLVSLLSLAASVWLVYLAALWTLSVTVSVLEQGLYGIGAIKRAMVLVQGRKWKAFAILLLSHVLAGVLMQFYRISYAPAAHSLWLRMAVVLVYLVLMEALSVYVVGAFTVYYYESRSCLGEESLNTAADDFVYTTVVVDEV